MVGKVLSLPFCSNAQVVGPYSRRLCTLAFLLSLCVFFLVGFSGRSFLFLFALFWAFHFPWVSRSATRLRFHPPPRSLSGIFSSLACLTFGLFDILPFVYITSGLVGVGSDGVPMGGSLRSPLFQFSTSLHYFLHCDLWIYCAGFYRLYGVFPFRPLTVFDAGAYVHVACLCIFILTNFPWPWSKIIIRHFCLHLLFLPEFTLVVFKSLTVFWALSID